MRKIVLLLFLVLGASCFLSAQEDTQWRDTTVEISGEWEIRRIEPAKKKDISAVLNNFTLPLEVGCAFSPKKGQARPGFYTRTGLEYRQFKTVGWSLAAEFDSYTRKYEKTDIDKGNITKGRDWTIDLLLGGGYRLPFVKNVKEYLKRPGYDNIWSLGLMLFAGASCLSVENVTPAGKDNEGKEVYHTEVMDTWVPSAKITASVEYTVCYGISLYTTIGYLQHFMKSPLQSDYVGDLIASLGITFFFR